MPWENPQLAHRCDYPSALLLAMGAAISGRKLGGEVWRCGVGSCTKRWKLVRDEQQALTWRAM